jgi:hypothetical protein
LLERGHECWVDAYVVSEALQALDALLAHLRMAPARPAIEAHAETAWLPDKDRPVLAAAIRLGCGALVTGDRMHFGSGYGRAFGGVKIHSPRTLAESLLA